MTRSIEDRLADFGIRHERDVQSHIDGSHLLFQGDIFIGRFSAHEAAELLRDMERSQ